TAPTPTQSRRGVPCGVLRTADMNVRGRRVGHGCPIEPGSNTPHGATLPPEARTPKREPRTEPNRTETHTRADNTKAPATSDTPPPPTPPASRCSDRQSHR